GNFLQTGSVFSFASIAPKLSKLNPAEGFRNVFLNLRPFIELLKTVFKMTIVAAIAGLVLWGAREDIAGLIAKPPEAAAVYTYTLVLEISLKIGLVFLIVGGA